MANRSNQRRHDAPPPTLTLTEMEASHHADHRAFMLKFCGTRINVTVTNKAEAVRRWIRNTRYANKNHLRRSNRTSMRCEGSNPELDGPQISQAAADAFIRYKRVR
ncbi:hypothetical protein Bca4012_094687 [Brassica carinata]